MSKLIYALSKGGFETAFDTTARSLGGSVYNSVVFTEDGYLFTHGKYFRIFSDATSIFTSETVNGIATIFDAKTPTTALGTINVGVTSVSGSGVISASALTNGATTISHNNSGVTANSYGPTAGSSTSINVPTFTVNATGHITAAGYQTATLNTVQGDIATGTFYLLGHTASTAGNAGAVKISSIYGNSSGYLTASRFVGQLNYDLSVVLNDTTTTYNNTSAKSVTLFAPTTAGTSKQILMSNGSGAPTWYSPVTSVSEASTNNDIPTAHAVWNAIGSGMAANDAMVFKGTLGDAGTITGTQFSALTSYNTGDTYRVITAGTYITKFGDTFIAEVGDLVICAAPLKRVGSG